MLAKFTTRRIAFALASACALYAAQSPAQAANADLVIRDLSIYPNPVLIAHEFVIEFNVVNHGPAQAPMSRARWTISGNPSMTFHCSVPALAPNYSHHCSWTWLSSPNKAANYGTHAEADVDRVVTEGTAGERNNVADLVLKVTR